jgi:thioredoxin-like negative regulator of GroEL
MIQANNTNFLVKVVDYDENRDIAEEMRVLRIPAVVVHDKAWREVGRFVEKPQHGATIEEELWDIVSKSPNAA